MSTSRRRVAPWLAAVVVIAALAACSFSESVDVPTDAIAPQLRVVAGADGTFVSVALYRTGAGANRVQLVAGETLTARVGAGAPIALAVTAQGTTSVRYEGTLDPSGEGDVVIVALQRPAFDDAPDTRVTIPAAPVITAPAPGTTVAVFAGEPTTYQVTWGPIDVPHLEATHALVGCLDPSLTDDEFEVLEALAALPGSLRDASAGATLVDVPTPLFTFDCDVEALIGGVTQAVAVDPAFGGLRAGSRVVHQAPPVPLSFRTVD